LTAYEVVETTTAWQTSCDVTCVHTGGQAIQGPGVNNESNNYFSLLEFSYTRFELCWKYVWEKED